jgi:hypothetical protein
VRSWKIGSGRAGNLKLNGKCHAILVNIGSVNLLGENIIKNKKFWEELIVFFP